MIVRTANGGLLISRRLDCRGLYDPLPIILLKRFLADLRDGEILEIISDDPAAESDMKAWSSLTGNKLIEVSLRDHESIFCVQKKSRG